MGLNNNVKNLIRNVADNDIQRAKMYAKFIVESDKTEANRAFCKSIMTKLQTPSANWIELPQDVKSLLCMEDASVSFNEARYYLTGRERQICEQICTANTVNGQLSEMGIRYLNATLLHGESGTGKTTFGRYVAYKLGVPFAYLNFAQCIGSYLGSTAKNIEKVFDYIKMQKCVFMLDEIDAIGMKRGKEDVGEMSRVVIGLMQALDLLGNDVVVIGATNRMDEIDEALTRRFSIKHEVKPLERWEAEGLIRVFLDDVGVGYIHEEVIDYAKTHNKQSDIINDVTIAIAQMLKGKTEYAQLNA